MDQQSNTTPTSQGVPQYEPAPPPPPAAMGPAATAAQTVPVAPGSVAAPRRSNSGRILNAILAVAVALAIAGVAFAVGRLTAPPSVTAGRFGNGGGQFFNGNGEGTGQGGQGRQGGGGAFFAGGGGITVQGTVESVSATTMTIKTSSGQTIQVALDTTTTYHAQSDATASDVKTGGTVLVRLSPRGFLNGGPGSSAAPGGGTSTSPTASDVTVVP